MFDSIQPDLPLIHEKLNQAVAILQAMQVDCWLTFVRETSAVRDPVLPLIYGHDVTWQSAFILTRSGRRIAILGRYDAINAERLGAYDTVIAYDAAFSRPLRQVLTELDPQQIALNYSTGDSHADGLTHGLYLLLQEHLHGTPFPERFMSAERIVAALRSRKTSTEVERVRAAVATTLAIYQRTFEQVAVGKTEREIGALMHAQVDALGLETAWERAACPAVNSGPDSPVGHAGPTEIRIAPGHLVHFDFGIKQNGYCSDIQRMLYVLRPGEEQAPEPVQRGFDVVVRAIQAAVAAMKPGVLGREVSTPSHARSSPTPVTRNTNTPPAITSAAPAMTAAACWARCGNAMATRPTTRWKSGIFTQWSLGCSWKATAISAWKRMCWSPSRGPSS